MIMQETPFEAARTERGHGHTPQHTRVGHGQTIGWGLVFRRARNFYHLIDSAVTTNFYCFNMSLKWPLLPIFIPFPPNFAQRALRARHARSAGASTGNTQHTCAGPTECARPHVHPPPAQHPTHNAAAHTTTYSSVAAVINSYSLSAQLGVALRHQLTPRVGMVPTNLKYTTGDLDRLPQRDLQRVVRSGLRLRDPDHLGRGA